MNIWRNTRFILTDTIYPMNHDHQSKEPSSPCKRVCRLDEDGMCVGCFRNLDEIANWSILSKDEKLDVLRKAHLRMQLRDLKF